MCGCVVGLLPIQDPQGCVWLNQRVPVILLSSYFAVIGSCFTARLLPLLRGEESSQTELLAGKTWRLL